MKLSISLAAGALVMAIASTAMAGTVLIKNQSQQKYGNLVVYYQADGVTAHTRPLSAHEGQRIPVTAGKLTPTKLVWMKHGKPKFTKNIPTGGQEMCAVVPSNSKQGTKLVFKRRHGKASCSHVEQIV